MKPDQRCSSFFLKGPIFTLKLSQKFDFQLLTTKSDKFGTLSGFGGSFALSKKIK